jgi:hypothetical protein
MNRRRHCVGRRIDHVDGADISVGYVGVAEGNHSDRPRQPNLVLNN